MKSMTGFSEASLNKDGIQAGLPPEINPSNLLVINEDLQFRDFGFKTLTGCGLNVSIAILSLSFFFSFLSSFIINL